MTIAADVAKLGNYDSTDITNMVAESYLGISLHMGVTQVEGADTNIDQIAKQYAVYLLDRLEIQRRAKIDSTVKVPPLMTQDIIELIAGQAQTVNQEWQVDSSPPDPPLHWRDC